MEQQTKGLILSDEQGKLPTLADIITRAAQDFPGRSLDRMLVHASVSDPESENPGIITLQITLEEPKQGGQK